MKILDWNIEWMNNWFQGGNQVAWKTSNSGIANVRALAQRVANVILGLDPDVISIQEGPSDPREMQLFITDFLSDQNNQPKYDSLGGLDGGAQKTYLLVKRNGSANSPHLSIDTLTRSLFDEWLADVNGDLMLEPYEFTRDPLVLEVSIAPSNDTVRIVNLHTKSKFVNQGQNLWNDPVRRPEFISAAMVNRRRISAEAMHVRNYLDELLEANPGDRIIVCGDFNDGPGLDFFERNYLTHGVADIILGSLYYPDLQFRHALIPVVPKQELFTAVFDDFVDGIKDRQVLLDHVLVSPSLQTRLTSARICHAEYQAQEDTARPADERDRWPSDHRPVLVEIQ